MTRDITTKTRSEKKVNDLSTRQYSVKFETKKYDLGSAILILTLLVMISILLIILEKISTNIELLEDISLIIAD